MTREEIIEFLRSELSVVVEASDHGNVRVSIMLGEETITSDDATVPVQSDTPEWMR